MQRALIEVLLLAVPAGVLGSWIVLRRLAFFTHAVGTVTFPGLVIAGPWGIPAQAGALGAALAFAGGLAVIPLAASPVLARNARWKNVVAFIATLAIPVLPFLGKPIMPGFREYATRWIFNAPAYDFVRAIVERIPTKEIWTHHPLRFQWLSDFVYRHVYPDFITRAILATVAIGGILLARRVSSAVAILLLCSPAIHPWYWLTLVPSALVERSRWLYVALCAPASYLLYDHVHPLIVYALCYALPLLALITQPRPSTTAS